MPNQRKPGLKVISAYVEEDLYAALQKIAAGSGTTIADLIREATAKSVTDYKDANHPKRKGN